MKHEIEKIEISDGRVIELPLVFQVEDGKDAVDIILDILEAVLKHYQTQNCDNRRPE